MAETRFFLASHSPGGLYSAHKSLTGKGEDDFLWILKGGTIRAKTLYLETVAEHFLKEGESVEYIHSPINPSSLEGLYLPSRGVGYIDGDSAEYSKGYPTASRQYIELSHFYSGEIKREFSKIMELDISHHNELDRAEAALNASLAVSPRKLPGLYGEREMEIIDRRVTGVIARELGGYQSSDKKVKHQKRLISSITCQGLVFFQEETLGLCKRIYAMDNDLGISGEYLKRIEKASREREISTIICPDPLEPSLLEAVLIPELELGFLALSPYRSFTADIYRHVRLDALPEVSVIRDVRPRLRRAVKVSRDLYDDALKSLMYAGDIYSQMEDIYTEYLDRESLLKSVDEHILQELM